MKTLSICVPTYNRSEYLKNLLENFASLSLDFINSIEFCITDNNSTDDTKKILEEYKRLSNLKIIYQDSNTGSAANLVFAASMSSSKWTLVIGDDDLIINEGLTRLIKFLESSESSKFDYILLNTKILNGTLFNYEEGMIASNDIKESFIQDFDNFGFLGSHLMSRKIVDQMKSRNIEDLRGWVSISMFSYHIAKHDIYYFHVPVVHQSPIPNSLKWKPADWVKLIIRRTEHCAYSMYLNNEKVYQKRLSRTFLWSKSFLKEIIISLAFQKKETKIAISNINFTKLGFNSFEKFSLLLALRILCLLPSFILIAIIKITKGIDFIHHYQILMKPSKNDGIERDINIV